MKSTSVKLLKVCFAQALLAQHVYLAKGIKDTQILPFRATFQLFQLGLFQGKKGPYPLIMAWRDVTVFVAGCTFLQRIIIITQE